MNDESGYCIHLLPAGTCAICNGSTTPQGQELNRQSIKFAVEELKGHGDFSTKDVALHPAVAEAHARPTPDLQFAQHIGNHLTRAAGTLGIVQVSPKGRSNAVWRSKPA